MCRKETGGIALEAGCSERRGEMYRCNIRAAPKNDAEGGAIDRRCGQASDNVTVCVVPLTWTIPAVRSEPPDTVSSPSKEALTAPEAPNCLSPERKSVV